MSNKLLQLFYIFKAVLCTDDPPIVPNDDRGMFDYKGNKSFTSNVSYRCPLPGWGYPSSGESSATSVCQADKAWSLTEVEDCVCKTFETLLFIHLVDNFIGSAPMPRSSTT